MLQIKKKKKKKSMKGANQQNPLRKLLTSIKCSIQGSHLKMWYKRTIEYTEKILYKEIKLKKVRLV